MAFTPISELGEFGLIHRLTEGFPRFYAHTLMGVGDDASVIRQADGQVWVISTDMLLEGVHFDLSYVPLEHLGYKSVIVNLSDILAMNAMPYGITVSVGASNRFTVEAMEVLYQGIRRACENYHVELLGGDTNSSQQGLVIAVTAFGQAAEEDIVYRSGAQARDLICVTGDLGAAYAGLLVLDREKATFRSQPDAQPDLSAYDYVVGRQLKPELQGPVLQTLKDRGVKPTSMMDISDGLASELFHICQQSRCGFSIYAHKLPVDYQTIKVAEEFELSPTVFALNGGEDYELLMTVPVSQFDRIKDIPNLSIIGHITNEILQREIILEGGQIVEVEAQGWQHFSQASQQQANNPDNPQA